MDYQTYTTVPAFTRAVWVQGRVTNSADPVKWGRDDDPPAIGSVVKLAFNRLGFATVTGYFVEGGWLGLLVTLHDAPDWHRKQRGNNPVAHVFGPEYQLVVQPKPKPAHKADDRHTRLEHSGTGGYAVYHDGAAPYLSGFVGAMNQTTYRWETGLYDLEAAKTLAENMGRNARPGDSYRVVPMPTTAVLLTPPKPEEPAKPGALDGETTYCVLAKNGTVTGVHDTARAAMRHANYGRKQGEFDKHNCVYIFHRVLRPKLGDHAGNWKGWCYADDNQEAGRPKLKPTNY